ncbi:hypothetical protein C8R45DRAFT_1133031 [Mycena sanguinolenta]|nr:hypothetical protein C8R45DRAFT_1133031 [Mycena sanguinolenta]
MPFYQACEAAPQLTLQGWGWTEQVYRFDGTYTVVAVAQCRRSGGFETQSKRCVGPASGARAGDECIVAVCYLGWTSTSLPLVPTLAQQLVRTGVLPESDSQVMRVSTFLTCRVETASFVPEDAWVGIRDAQMMTSLCNTFCGSVESLRGLAAHYETRGGRNCGVRTRSPRCENGRGDVECASRAGAQTLSAGHRACTGARGGSGDEQAGEERGGETHPIPILYTQTSHTVD